MFSNQCVAYSKILLSMINEIISVNFHNPVEFLLILSDEEIRLLQVKDYIYFVQSYHLQDKIHIQIYFLSFSFAFRAEKKRAHKFHHGLLNMMLFVLTLVYGQLSEDSFH